MNRPNRQAVMTAALLVLTVFPTVYVISTAWSISRPGHLRAIEAELGRRTGLRVSIRSVRYPRPGEVVYQGVSLHRVEATSAGPLELARAEAVWLRRGDHEVTIETQELRFQAEDPRRAMGQIGALLEKSGESPYERISLSAPTCDLDLGGGVAPYRLRELIGQFVADSSAPSIRASYRLISPGSSTRCELNLTRDRQATPVRTTLAFKTMEGLPLPARVLDPFFNAKDWLGPEAKVEGSLSFTQDGSKEWEAEFAGNLLDIDLAELVDRRFPMHHLRGRARLTVDSARWAEQLGQGYGWVEAKGELSAGPGVIGFGLLHALATEMKFRKGPKIGKIVSAGQIDLDFRAMALAFTMSPNGEIKINGGLGNEFADEVVLAGPSYPLASAPEGAANVRGLIKALFPITERNHSVMVPLTEKSRMLLCLPMPPDLTAKAMGGN